MREPSAIGREWAQTHILRAVMASGSGAAGRFGGEASEHLAKHG